MSDWKNIVGGSYGDEFARRQTGPITAVPTPLPGWNAVCGGDGGRIGLARGWFVVVGGNPGFGKTLMALLMADQALRANEPAAILSLEMHHGQLASRFYSMATGVWTSKLEKGPKFDLDAWEQVRAGLSHRYPDGELYVNEEPFYDPEVVMEHVYRLHNQGVRWFVVDYLQLIGSGDDEMASKAITSVARSLAHFARDNDSTVIGLSQFNTRTSEDYTKSPTIHGLYSGNLLAATADEILLLDHSRYAKDERSTHLARTWAILGKNKHGDRVQLPIEWDFRTLTVREADPHEEHLWPTHK